MSRGREEDDAVMKESEMSDELINQLDSGMTKGVGHVNVFTDESADEVKEVETMGCTDCSRTPLACSVPTLHQGLDDYQ
jgi:hypothetical protein